MLIRSVSMLLAALALAMFVSQASVADEKDKDAKVHEGKVVKAVEGMLTMTDKSGENKHTHKVPATAKITCDKKECKLDDLKEGVWVRVVTKGENVVTRIDARTDKK